MYKHTQQQQSGPSPVLSSTHTHCSHHFYRERLKWKWQECNGRQVNIFSHLWRKQGHLVCTHVRNTRTVHTVAVCLAPEVCLLIKCKLWWQTNHGLGTVQIGEFTHKHKRSQLFIPANSTKAQPHRPNSRHVCGIFQTVGFPFVDPGGSRSS